MRISVKSLRGFIRETLLETSNGDLWWVRVDLPKGSFDPVESSGVTFVHAPLNDKKAVIRELHKAGFDFDDVSQLKITFEEPLEPEQENPKVTSLAGFKKKKHAQKYQDLADYLGIDPSHIVEEPGLAEEFEEIHELVKLGKGQDALDYLDDWLFRYPFNASNPDEALAAAYETMVAGLLGGEPLGSPRRDIHGNPVLFSVEKPSVDALEKLYTRLKKTL